MGQVQLQRQGTRGTTEAGAENAADTFDMLLSQFDSLKNKFENASAEDKEKVERIFDGAEVWNDLAEF